MTQIEDHILNAKTQVREIVQKSTTDPHTVIARYTAAIAVNFTDWIGKTIPWIRHETAYQALVDNLRCESVDDHIKMLLRFAKLSNALPSREEYAWVEKEVGSIRRLFSNPTEAGLSGVALLAFLENTSEIFIPDLADRGRKCGCIDFTYTNVHGEADKEHSNAFLNAVEAETLMGYSNPENNIEQAFLRVIHLIEKIYT